MRTAKTREAIAAELIAKASKQANGCWICHLKTNAKGYVPIQPGGRDGKKYRAHRFIWEMYKGSIPEGMNVLHSCDTRNCINYEEHLFLGTAADNTRDMMNKGRGKYIIPDIRKVDIDLLFEMLDLEDQGLSRNAIGKIVGLSPVTVAAYLDGKRNAR